MLEEFVRGYRLEDVLALEQTDAQYQALAALRERVKAFPGAEELFLYSVVQCALVGYQVAGSGPLWWSEFALRAGEEWDGLRNLENTADRWYGLLTTSRYNRRLYNLKTGRLRKLEALGLRAIMRALSGSYEAQMLELWAVLQGLLGQSAGAKTIVFACKMWGYGKRIVSGLDEVYPAAIPIPIDSRLTKIHQESGTSEGIEVFFAELALRTGLAPLHLDSVLWIEWWERRG